MFSYSSYLFFSFRRTVIFAHTAALSSLLSVDFGLRLAQICCSVNFLFFTLSIDFQRFICTPSVFSMFFYGLH
jgi:hypothetical protein